jgi:cell division protein FtsW (lipid II flippase)
MSQRQWIVIIGVWVMIFLFLGFPASWEKAFAILTGLVIIIFAYRIKFKETAPKSGSSFTDNVSSSANQSERAVQNLQSIPDAEQ